MYRRIALQLPNYIQQGAKRGTWRQDWVAYAIYQAMLWFSPLMRGYNPLTQTLRQCYKACRPQEPEYKGRPLPSLAELMARMAARQGGAKKRQP